MPRTALYLRVSSTRQEDGYSLDTQEAGCRAYAAQHGLTVDECHVYRETQTGVELWDRAVFSRVRQAIERREFDAIVFYVLDRFSRDPVHQLIVMAEAARHDIEVHSVLDDIDDSDEGQLIQFVKGYAGKREWRMLRERTMRGKRARVESGKLLPASKPLYGYQWRDETKAAYDIDPETAPVVIRIYQWLITGDTLRSIIRRLSEEGIATPTGRSPMWSLQSIRNILLNPAYKGEAYGFGLKRSGKGISQHFDPTRAIALPAGTVPAIVDPATWEAAQRILARNKSAAIRNAREPEAVLLRGGYAVCGYCGSTMTARPRSDRGYEYVCGSSRHAIRTCERPTISAQRLDRIVWGRLRSAIVQEDIIAGEIQRQRSADPTVTDRAVHERTLTELERRRDNLVHAISLTDDPDTAAPLVEQLSQITSQRKAASAALAELETRRDAWEMNQHMIAGVETWRQRVAVNIDLLNWKERRLLMDIVQLRVEVWRANHDPRIRIQSLIDPALMNSDQYDKWYWSQVPAIRLEWVVKRG